MCQCIRNYVDLSRDSLTTRTDFLSLAHFRSQGRKVLLIFPRFSRRQDNLKVE